MRDVAASIRAVPAQGGPRSAETVITARQLAQGYFESGMRDYRLLYAIWTEDNAGTRYPSFDEFLGPGVTAATQLSFALEIYLKVLFAQRMGTYPHGHGLSPILRDLPEPVRQSLAQRLQDSSSRDSTRYLTEFSLQLSATDQPGQLQYRLNCVDDDPPDLSSLEALSLEIRLCDDGYNRWRYVYERGNAVERISARFFSLIHLNKAAAAEIDGFAEGVLIAGRSD